MYRFIGSLFVGLLVVSFASSAFASDDFKQALSVQFSQKKTNSSTGIKAELVASDAGEPGNKPRAARKVEIRLPKGTKFNLKVPELCKLPDQQILDGKCPKGSKVGTGIGVANATPLVSVPVNESVTAYAVSNGIAFALKRQGLGQDFVLKGTISGNVLTFAVPSLAVSGVSIVLTTFKISIKAAQRRINGKEQAFITTPKSCSDGQFKSNGKFDYTDGSSLIVEAASPCKASRR